MPFHNDVLSSFLSLGYSETPGMCHGFTLRWLEACLINEEGLFKQRVQKILDILELVYLL